MKHLFPYLLAIYPTLHLGLKYVLPYFPDPPQEKSWYSVVYHALEYFAIGNGQKETPKQ